MSLAMMSVKRPASLVPAQTLGHGSRCLRARQPATGTGPLCAQAQQARTPVMNVSTPTRRIHGQTHPWKEVICTATCKLQAHGLRAGAETSGVRERVRTELWLAWERSTSALSLDSQVPELAEAVQTGLRTISTLPVTITASPVTMGCACHRFVPNVPLCKRRTTPPFKRHAPGKWNNRR